MHAYLGCAALSATCTAGPNTPGYFLVSLVVTWDLSGLKNANAKRRIF